MAKVELENAYGYVVQISADYDSLCSFLKHLKYMAFRTKEAAEKEGFDSLAEVAMKDFHSIADAIETLKAEV